MNKGTQGPLRSARKYCVLATLALGLFAASTSAQAQSAIIYGSLGNFDISNDTGQVCHGFEVELEGLTPAEVPYSFSAQRYGAPSVVPYAGGVRVRWESPYDASAGTVRRADAAAHRPVVPGAVLPVEPRHVPGFRL